MAPTTTTYLVSGATGGLGLGLVEAFLKKSNTRVFAAARAPAASSGLKALVAEYGDKLSLIQLELTDEDSIKRAAAEVSAASPEGLDVLVNNGGFLGATVAGDVFDPTGEDFMKVLQINVVSMYLMCKHFRPLLLKGQLKKIINTGSTAGSLKNEFKTVGKGGGHLPPLLPYKTSKTAVNMQTLVMANELYGEGITVVALHPGFVQTDMGTAAGAPAGIKPPMTVAQSVAAQTATIEALSLKDSGGYLNYDGTPLEF